VARGNGDDRVFTGNEEQLVPPTTNLPMPTYEYRCDACGAAFERFQSITAAPVKKCPECGKNKVRRLIGTGAGLIFKGSGFYITDYRDKSYTDKAKADTAGGGGTAPSTDSKPASDGASGGAGAKAGPKPAAKTEPAPAAPKAESKPRSDAKKK
jgi:putative FmdB family regulatory protein